MMWLLFAVLLVFARHADCGALRCSEGSSCTAEEDSKERNLPSGIDCAPGTSWMNQCNHCWCEGEGYGMCTLMGCFNYAEPETLCAPNSSWRKGCNVCHCTGGMPVCTERKCKQDTGSTIAAVDEGYSEHAQRSQPKAHDKLEKRETRCEPNAEFKSECNVCKCSANGRSFSCSQNECLEGDVNGDVEVFQETDGADHIERHSVCEPYTVFYIACNVCQCNSQGTDFACSLKICPLPKDVEVFHEFRGTQSTQSRKKRAFQEVPKQCQPGQEFRMDCNKCLCDNEGQNFSCTRMDCNALNNHNGDAFSSRTKRETEKQQMKCVPGSVFDRECNVCRCSDEGQHAVCTMNRCASPDGSTEGPAPEQDEGFRCNPGEQFAQKCNDCTCSADGRSVFCTLRLCDKDIAADI